MVAAGMIRVGTIVQIVHSESFLVGEGSTFGAVRNCLVQGVLICCVFGALSVCAVIRNCFSLDLVPSVLLPARRVILDAYLG